MPSDVQIEPRMLGVENEIPDRVEELPGVMPAFEKALAPC